MITFQLSADDWLTATVSTDEAIHPDLLDELAARCLRLFADGCAGFPSVDPDVERE
jgi:hypothetical protein